MRKRLMVGLIFILAVMVLVIVPLTDAGKDFRLNRVSELIKARNAVQQPARVTAYQYKAANFGTSAPIKELAQRQKTVANPAAVEIKDKEEVIEEKREANLIPGKTGFQTTSNELGEAGERERNFKNREIIRNFDPDAKTEPDAAIATVPTRKPGNFAAVAIPTPSTSFEAISLTDTTAIPGQGFLPPDTVGEIGPNHFVQMVNSSFRIYDRSGTALIPLTSIGTLFSSIPGPCANNIDGDPIVMYDQLADRWILSEFCTVANPNNHQLIAVSKTGDPTGQYYLYDFMMPNNKFNDYPKFGVWSDGYYMTDNEFNQAGNQFLGAGVFAFDRNKMLSGDPAASYVYIDKAEGCPACQFGGMLPADVDGFIPPPPGSPAPIIQFDANEFGATDSLRIFDFHVDFATPANSTLTERTGSPLAVAAFDPREVPAGSRNVIPQPGTGVKVDAISDRLMYRLAYRNFGTHESLVMNHTVNAAINPAFRAGVRYYEIRKTSPTAAWTIQEQGTMSGPAADTENRWMGSTALNGAGSQAIGYSVSSGTVFPSIRYAGRLATDPAGSLGQGEATLVDGTSAQTHSSGRWGDYSALTVDPLDDCTFWYTTEYIHGAAAPDNTRWHTRVGSFLFGPCVPIQKGILKGTIISTAGGASIPNATISATPFVRTTNGSGQYNIDPIGVGNYSVTISAPLYNTVTVPTVMILQGGTVTLNASLAPSNVLVPGETSLVAESCEPANEALDPNETVTVQLSISNQGGAGATTSDLVATLQSTGGVNAPSGPQNYGAVVQGGPSVTRSFTFSVDRACGEELIATLQLQDGATDLGTIDFKFQTGTSSGATIPLTVSSNNISTAIPDVDSVDIPIDVTQTGALADVNVKLRLNHTFDSDLTLTLIAPDGTPVTLARNRGGSGDNFGGNANDCSGTPTVFDDSAATAIGAGAAPFTGSFKPESPLSDLNGKSIHGTWILRVSDADTPDVGTVGCVTLEMTRSPYLCCGVVGVPVITSGGAGTIVSESVSPANNAPDPGETLTVNLPLLNVGDGPTANLNATLLPDAGVTPITTNANYGAVNIGDIVSRPFTFVANGSCGDTITLSLQLQDGDTDFGTVTYSFHLGAAVLNTATFTSSTAITIPATGTGATTGAPATPYPSTITVSGITDPVVKVRVSLKQISHTFPGDIDVLLVSPTGRKFVIMSDVIGGTDLTGQTYSFDDEAAENLPASGAPPATGSFKPTNINAGDAFPAPAPAAPYLSPSPIGVETLASAFAGQDPNGTWSLYVTDDAGTDTGNMAGGWDLTIVSEQSICNVQACAIECPANITVSSNGSNGAIVNYPVPGITGNCGSLDYSIPSGSFFPVGTTPVTVGAQRETSCTFNVNVLPDGPTASSLLISEFRLSGPSGNEDEYVELYNPNPLPVVVSVSDASTGWAVVAADGNTRFVIPTNTVIPAHGHYLGVNSNGYSLSGLTGADAVFTTDIPDNSGVALFNTSSPANFTLGNRLDAVGANSAPALYKEGTGLPTLTTFSIESAFVRDACGKQGSTAALGLCPSGGALVDNNNNATDFFYVDTNHTSAGAGARLGAPGPEGLASPVQMNSGIPATLVFPCMAASIEPNRIRDFTPNPAQQSTFGTMEIRRKFTNSTGAPITKLKFRIIDLSTASVPLGVADLRARDSNSIVGLTDNCGGPALDILGSTVETPPVQSIGGGINSTLTVATSQEAAPVSVKSAKGSIHVPRPVVANVEPNGMIRLSEPLGPGDSINIRFLLGIEQTGQFKFYVNVEALIDTTTPLRH